MPSDTGGAVVRVSGLDHVVLRCADVERTLTWYVEVLGLAPERVEGWRRGELPFPSVRVDPGTIIDLIGGGTAETSGHDGHLDHLCLVVEPTDLEALVRSGRLDVIEGPVPRSGARGMGTSVYVRDPDGTVVELRHY
jgi:catechol 2,3-dioxygenase-like lactoylglutathione lyase family enzyme